ncbi:MAG: hypothetical protein IPP15_13990 [Saprospiraceae bacterium]|uniref:O-antigen polysaccharide polymerase Wzy n=1 Tax=Candidatus Opimibacter skivensis TaxID=2982028 RepID=A0A9D7XTB1_9BACT|nr:hypothetical protein [Candidatus Opimibacter skivensis]
MIYFITFLISIGVKIAIDYLWNGHNFLLLYGMQVIAIVIMMYLFRKLFGPDIWKSLPTVTTAYIFLALYVSTLLIYNSEFLKHLLNWEDYLILKALSYGLIFIQFIWISYHIGTFIFSGTNIKPIIKYIPIVKIYILILFGLLANFIAIISGAFGILQNTNTESISNYSTYIDLGQQLGLLGLIILTYQHTHRRYLIAITGILFFILGIVSGGKQAALMPLLAIAITLYFKNQRFPKAAILAAVIGLPLSFGAVTTIRQYYFDSKSKGVTSVLEVKEISEKALNQKEFDKAYGTYSLNQHILIRLFYGNAIVKAISYCERHDFGVPENSRFYQVLFAPLYAVVPRIIMPDKPESTFGNWFASEVFVGYKVKYSIGITPVGYGYMVNGFLGVISVAAVLGLFMALIKRLLYGHYIFIYILVFIKAILPADVTWLDIAGNIKLILVYWIIFKLLEVRIFTKKVSEPILFA